MDLPRFDPLPAYNFLIVLLDTSSTFSTIKSGALGLALGGFTECSGLESSLETMEYREGGVNDRIQLAALDTLLPVCQHRKPSRIVTAVLEAF